MWEKVQKKNRRRGRELGITELLQREEACEKIKTSKKYQQKREYMSSVIKKFKKKAMMREEEGKQSRKRVCCVDKNKRQLSI